MSVSFGEARSLPSMIAHKFQRLGSVITSMDTKCPRRKIMDVIFESQNSAVYFHLPRDCHDPRAIFFTRGKAHAFLEQHGRSTCKSDNPSPKAIAPGSCKRLGLLSRIDESRTSVPTNSMRSTKKLYCQSKLEPPSKLQPDLVTTTRSAC
jgi:hypothetical protein